MAEAGAKTRLGPSGKVAQSFGAVVCLAAAAVIACRYPIEPIVLFLTLTIYAMALWRWPTCWLFVIPAILPTVDLSPWTGWLLIGEYDLFGLVTIGILLLRTRLIARDFIVRGLSRIAIVGVGVSYLISAIIGLRALPDMPHSSDFVYLQPENALRLAAGFIMSLALLPFLRERQRMGEPIGQWLASGMIGGLTVVAAATIFERALFPGILNFNADYRVVSTFSSMHLGGGHIGAYIAFSLPFLVILIKRPRILTVTLGLGIATIAAYALVVTFARAAYVSAAVGITMLIGSWISTQHGVRRVGATFVGALFALLVFTILATAALDSGLMGERFSRWAPDLITREQNWTDGWEIRDPSLSALIFGMGLGTYPRAVLARRTNGDVPTNITINQNGGEHYLSVVGGVPSYVDQKVQVASDRAFRFSAYMRSIDARGTLTVLLCEKLLLYSDNCRSSSFKPTPRGQWQLISATLSTRGMSGRTVMGWHRPITLSLVNQTANSALDIKQVKLVDAGGHDVIQNGNFTAGSERWYVTDDNHLVWRMKDLFLMLAFETGLLGLTSFTVLVATAIFGALAAAKRGDHVGLAIIAALTAFICSSVFDYLLEAPRLSALFYLVCFMGLTMLEATRFDNSSNSLVA